MDFNYLLKLTSCATALLLLSSFPRVEATDPDAICPQNPIMCVECSTQLGHKYCADPFNKTLIKIKKVPLSHCAGFCVKWVRRTKTYKPGDPEDFIRTCSRNLTTTMQVNMVCIKESRTGSGYLCYCNKETCNSTIYLSFSPALIIFLSVMLHAYYL